MVDVGDLREQAGASSPQGRRSGDRNGGASRIASGIIPYLVTPTTPTGGPDAGAMREVAARAIEAGVDAVVPLGSSGEFPYVEDGARSVLIEAAVDQSAGRVPVVPAVGGFGLSQAVAQARAAQDAGADGVLCIILAFGPLGDDEVLGYVHGLVSAVDIPVGLYHNPALGTARFTDRVVHEAFTSCGVTFVKEASGDLDTIARWSEQAPAGAAVFSSTAVSPTAAMLVGAAGWMSGPASAFPAESVRLFQLCRDSRWREAIALERALDPALELFRRLGPSRGAKALVGASGLPVGPPIAPLAPLSAEEHRYAAECVTEVNRRIAALGDPAT